MSNIKRKKESGVPVINVKNLVKYFDKVEAVNDFSFKVFQGEVVAIIDYSVY